MARWVLVRHGATEWNKDGRIQGQTNTGMSAAGRVQVAALAERLRPIKFDAVYTSDLMRCIETATLLVTGRPQSAEPTALLRELHYGEWEGLTWAEVQERDPEVHDEWLRNDPNFQAPEGESLHDLMRRASEFIARVREVGEQGTVLIVTHGGMVRALALALLGLDDALFRRLGGVAPASVSIVELYGETTVLESWNDAAHYKPLA